MSYRPHNLAIKVNNDGEHFMAHKPSDTKTPDITQLEKPHVASVTSSMDNQPAGKKTNRPNLVDTSILDTKLRVAESSLENGSQDFAESMGAGVGGMDKVRDLLFGGQMRDYDKRFKRLEEHYNQENIRFRDDIAQRLKIIEERVEGEVDSLSEKAKVDRQERLSVTAELEHNIKVLKNELNTRLTQLDDQFSRDIKNLRQQMHNKIQELATQMRQQNDSLVGLINQEVAQLQDEKVNRSYLASFFNEFAVRPSRNVEAPSEME